MDEDTLKYTKDLSVIETDNHFYYINHPVVAMRQHPDALSEVVSQAFFSEQVHILDQFQDWVKIKTLVDGYIGWIKKEALHINPSLFLNDPNESLVKVNRNTVHLYHVKDTIYGPIITLPFESRLKLIELPTDSEGRWVRVAMHNGLEAYIQRGDVVFGSTPINNFQEICALSLNFLGLPYTWGGRSSFGYDCSGFVQMLYRQMGIFLPRDSKDQCHWNQFHEVSVNHMLPGDLIFFGFDLTKIRHVGLCLENGNFIHATKAENQPYIRTSSIDQEEWQASGKGIYPFRTARRLTNLK